jgi:N-acylneuraminate cytidylyltransferase
MSKIAIIPARGGSKRIPRKNIKDFLGKPIIAYSIQVALESGLFDEVMVSTDSQEIADIAIKYGASVPFLRSKKNSNDYASTVDVVEEVLSEYKKIDKNYKYICCFYPTSPLINKDHLIKGMKLIEEFDLDSIFTVIPFSHPIQRAFFVNKFGFIEMINPENAKFRSQDLQKTYHDAGQFYFLNSDRFLKEKKIFMEKTLPLILSDLDAQDIDSEEDWKMAELKYKLKYSIN